MVFRKSWMISYSLKLVIGQYSNLLFQDWPVGGRSGSIIDWTVAWIVSKKTDVSWSGVGALWVIKVFFRNDQLYIYNTHYRAPSKTKIYHMANPDIHNEVYEYLEKVIKSKV